MGSAVDRVERYIDDNILIWATQTILLPAQVNLSTSINERAARALTLEKSGFMKIDLVWDLRGDDGEPLHFFLEFGTRPHKIEAKGKEHGGANALHWTGPSGENVFAKIVNHPGSTKHVGLIQRIKDERMPALQAKIISETQNKMETDSL